MEIKHFSKTLTNYVGDIGCLDNEDGYCGSHKIVSTINIEIDNDFIVQFSLEKAEEISELVLDNIYFDYEKFSNFSKKVKIVYFIFFIFLIFPIYIYNSPSFSGNLI